MAWRAADANRFFELLGAAQRPLIYAGGGVINAEAADALREFSQAFGVPVVTTLMGIGAMDTQGPLCVRMLGMHGTAYANYAVDDCDFLIALGARFDDRVATVPAKFAPNAHGHRAVRHRPRGDRQGARCSGTMSGLLDEALRILVAHGRRARLQARSTPPGMRKSLRCKRAHAFNYDRTSVAIQPYSRDRGNQPPDRGEAIIATGVGQHQMWAAQYFDFRQPRLWLTSGSMGTMGFGLPAAIGAQIAHPGRAGHRHRWRCQHPHESTRPASTCSSMKPRWRCPWSMPRSSWSTAWRAWKW